MSGKKKIIGRKIVVKKGNDEYGKGGKDESRKKGKEGNRVDWGVIGIK